MSLLKIIILNQFLFQARGYLSGLKEDRLLELNLTEIDYQLVNQDKKMRSLQLSEVYFGQTINWI